MIQEMETLRADYIRLKNPEYHAAMNALVDEEIPRIDIAAIRAHFLESVKRNPEQLTHSYQHRMVLEPLFRSQRIVQKGSWIDNPVPPTELWLHLPEPRFTPYDSDAERVRRRPGPCRIILDKANHTDFRGTLDEYICSTDPDIQRVRAIFREAFPDAVLHPVFFAHAGSNPAHLSIEITYTLSRTLPGLEPFRLADRVQNDPGRGMIW
jgi:hypothetical protein